MNFSFLSYGHFNLKQFTAKVQTRMHMKCAKLNRSEIKVLINTSSYFLSKKDLKVLLCVPWMSQSEGPAILQAFLSVKTSLSASALMVQ